MAAAVLLLLGVAFFVGRSHLGQIAAAERAPDASPGLEAPKASTRGLFPRGASKHNRSAPEAAPAHPDGGQPAVSIRTVRSLFEVSSMLHLNADEADQNVDRYCAETAKLPKPLASPPLVDPDDPGTQERDAAYFLLPRVSWGTTPRTMGTLELPDAITQRLRAVGDSWPSALTAADTAGLDFAWMTQLAPFDHWSLATVGPVAQQAATIDPMLAPIPYYLPLLDWAKLRLVRALATADGTAALGDVQHLADLIASNGILIASQSAARIVWNEQQFEGAATAAGLHLPPPFADQADYRHFQDLALAGVSFMFPGVDPAVAKRGLACSPAPCAILTEQITLRREYDSFADTAEDQASFGLADQSDCDRTLFELMETALSAGLEALEGNMGAGQLPLEKAFGAEVRDRAVAKPAVSP